MINEYSEGRTDIIISKHPLTTEDNPVTVICLEKPNDLPIELGFDVNITVSQHKISSGHVVESLATQRHKVDVSIQKLELFADVHLVFRTCFRINAMINDLSEWVTRIDLDMHHPSGWKDIWDIYFTSNENSYGALTQNWLDGEVEEWYFSRISFLGKLVNFRISKITEYSSNLQECTDQPYYNCLATVLAESKECEQYGGVCEVMSLPTANLKKCLTHDAFTCSSNLFWDIFKSKECRRDGKKYCNSMEYHTERNWNLVHEENFMDSDNSKSYVVEYQMVSPRSTNGERENNPHKSVKTEYYIWGGLSFVAQLGGILATTIEFSFYGAGTWITSKISVMVGNTCTNLCYAL